MCGCAVKLLALVALALVPGVAAENLFDQVYTMHVREGTVLGGGRPKIECLPATMQGCSAEEVTYVNQVKSYASAQLKQEKERLIDEERTQRPAHASDAEYWLFQRKSIVYHLLDDAKKEANKKWLRSHDEL